MLFRLLLVFFLCSPAFAKEKITIGSKRFSENYILAEIMAQILEEQNYEVHRKFGLGGTMVAWNALTSGEIDTYPEYTGTIIEAIFRSKNRDYDKINLRLEKQSIKLLDPFGLNNTYCIVVRKETADKYDLNTIGDLSHHPSLLGGLTGEFQGRKDGWAPLTKTYNLSQKVKSIEVPLNYEALRNKSIDFADAFSTDPLISKYEFVLLEDNKGFFPRYEAAPMVRMDLPKEVIELLNSFAGQIDDTTIVELNKKLLDGDSYAKVANDFLVGRGYIKTKRDFSKRTQIDWSRLVSRTKDHLALTLIAVLLATLIAVPLATYTASRPRLSRIVLGATGILQTIPSIALLTFMIPFFGIGFKPALVGLFIYSLLPIVRNTHVAMSTIDPRIIIAARGIGLYPLEVLLSVKLPLAFPTILTGIRTATTLNIGTATLAAFIGAGGLGEPIVTGLSLNDTSLVLEGAIPAALLAVIVDFMFSVVDKVFTKNI